MSLYKITGTELVEVNERKIDLEKDLQSLVEGNLENIFGYKYICTEFQLNGLRIDTLAYDQESKSFVIIEYKRDRSFSVIDQGYAYLALMLNNKADFILEYNERVSTALKKDSIDWSQSKVIFIANSFTNYQQNAINFKDLAFELWEAKKYDDNLLSINQIKPLDTSESIKTVTKSGEVVKINKEVKKYTSEDHFKLGTNSRDIYEKLREQLLQLEPRFIENAQKNYVSFKIGWKNVIGIESRKDFVLFTITRTAPNELKDPEKRVTARKDALKNYGQNMSDYRINTPEEVDYAVFLARQVINKY